jgi:hypothetical protein
MRPVKFLAVALGAATLIGGGMSAQAGYIVTLTEVGPNVVATGGGTIDTTDLRATTNGTQEARISPGTPLIVTGPASFARSNNYDGFTGPSSFGNGLPTTASSGSGDIVGLDSDLNVPACLWRSPVRHLDL